MKKLILIIILFFAGCHPSIEIIREIDKNDPSLITVQSGKIIIKESIPFNLDELFFRFLFVKNSESARFVFGFFYTGNTELLMEKLELIVDGKSHYFLPKIKSESQDLGMLGFSESVYIRVSDEIIAEILAKKKCKLTIHGKIKSYSLEFNEKLLKNLEDFQEYIEKL